jgi:hypothetical protein
MSDYPSSGTAERERQITWNGKKLSLHAISAPKNTSSMSVLGLSCDGGTCDVVGYSTKGASVIGESLTARGTSLGKPHTANGDSLYGVSCVSKSLCYAAGNLATKAGLVVTIKGGVIGSPKGVASDLHDIACSGSKCIAVGLQIPPKPSSDVYWGTLVSVSAGQPTGTTFVTQSFGFDGIARIGAFFAAAGPSQQGNPKLPSEVTTG